MLPYIIPSVFIVVLTLTCEYAASANVTDADCEVRAQTDAGWVCGRTQNSGNYSYASFLNVPYASQPIGDLRFKELQAVEPWDDLYDATSPGPICPQMVDFYGSMMTNKNVSEACIHANIYTPSQALENVTTYLPILVFIHGGGFVSGSGDADVHGPEYMMKNDTLLMTFNYRLHVMGYLFLNSSTLPGNNGLRDCVTFLKWVQVNARYFGGNPADVTLAGQSAGSATAHLLTLSKATSGLFKRTILMSGVGVRSFFTASQEYALNVTNLYISSLGINATDPDEIYQQLIAMSLETLMNATTQVLAEHFPITFAPVIETVFPNVTTVIDEDPETLLNNGQGSNISLIIGFTDLEEEFFVTSFSENNMLERIQKNPLIMLPPDLAYKLTSEKALELANRTQTRYFNGTPTIEKYGKYFADSAFVYPAMKLAQIRSSSNTSAPVFLYHFVYNASFSAIKVTKNVTYDGAAHVDDLTFVFKTNSMNGTAGFDPPSDSDAKMREQMTSFFKNFMTCDNPVCDTSNTSTWPAEDTVLPLKYEKITKPDNILYTELSDYQQDIFEYYDGIYSEE